MLVHGGGNIDYEDPDFGSPLYLCLVNKRFDIFQWLLKRDATAGMGSRNFSPLVAASSYGELEHVQMLLAHGAIVAERQPNRDISYLGAHAMETAASYGKPGVFDALLEAAEQQGVGLEYYREAYIAAQCHGSRNRPKLRSKMARLFPAISTARYTIQGLQHVDFRFHISQDAKISLIKEFAHHYYGTPQDQFQLMHSSRLLPEHLTLLELKIPPESKICAIPKAQWGSRNDGG